MTILLVLLLLLSVDDLPHPFGERVLTTAASLSHVSLLGYGLAGWLTGWLVGRSLLRTTYYVCGTIYMVVYLDSFVGILYTQSRAVVVV